MRRLRFMIPEYVMSMLQEGTNGYNIQSSGFKSYSKETFEKYG
jgi:hypothetical protein